MKVKVSDYIVKFLVDEGIRHVFLVSGGANLPIVDSLARNMDIDYVCTLHEQTAAMAAEAYARVTGNIGAAVVTTGPGGTNAITGVLGAWQDSIPCVVISGQTRSDRLEDKPIRQLSIQGLDIVSVIKPITKYSVTIRNSGEIKYHLRKASYIARSGRPGPVWLDIPLDIASALVEVDELPSFDPSELKQECLSGAQLTEKVGEVVNLIAKSERPIILVGTGVRLSKAEDEMLQLIELLKVPYVCSFNIQDLASHCNPLYMGSPGVFGVRYANFAVQNSDLLLSVGSRLSMTQTGHNYKAFARAATKVVVDIDKNELGKGTVIPDFPIHCSAKIFLTELLRQLAERNDWAMKDISPWLVRCLQWKARYPVVLPEFRSQDSYVNSYVFIDTLSEELDGNDVIVLANGTAFTGTFQSFKVKKGQRIFHCGGSSPMGFCLPGAIGACFGIGRKRTICITGDGSIQLNLQELQTIVYHDLPIKIFMLNNEGYLAIRITQKDWFNSRYAASSKEGGLSLPHMRKVAAAYGIKTERIDNHSELRQKIRSVLNAKGPIFCEVIMDPNQPLIPYLGYSKRKDGSRYPSPLEDMSPLLARKEFFDNMIIEPWVEP